MLGRMIHDRELLLRQLLLMILDATAVLASSVMALLLRFNLSYNEIEKRFLEYAWKAFLPASIVIIIIFWCFKLYHSVWQYAGFYEVQQIILAVVLATLVKYIGMKIAGFQMPRSYWFLFAGGLVAVTGFTRFAYRLARNMKKRFVDRRRGVEISRVMVIGAGAAADVLIRELKTSEYLHKRVICVIDDDTDLRGKMLRGCRIVGGREDIVSAAAKYEIDEIIIAMPSVSKKTVAEIATICNETGCELKTLPGVYQLVNDEVHVSNLRHVDIEDLLGREPISVDLSAITEYLKEKVVLVTGGGGSIGSELCRQIAKAKPKQVIVVDIYENNAYEIQQELLRSYPELDLVVLIASVRNTNRMNAIFEQYHPNIVFHAAAHKHVPLMEVSPNEAIKNNVFGTLKTVQAADKHGVERFVLISTDKAVNPTNIMGASKRICEMIIQAYNRRSKTEYVAVRFGNVLGSNGSVIPLFKKQIKAGGPVTVTHPDIIRYFMTIPEAVSLVLQAGAYAKGGEIFVLDMGEPMKIVDLARNLIRLSGYIPDEDIMIEYIGLRPGEKLFEECLMEEEDLEKTENNHIFIAQPIEMEDDAFLDSLDGLKDSVYEEKEDVREMLQSIVPTYTVTKEE